MSNYLQDAATYSKDKWTSVVDYFYGPNIPPKPLGTRTKENVIQFTKNHPYITAQLGLFAASVVVGKISKAIAKRVKQDTILELDLDNIDLTERPVTPNLFEALNTSVVKKIHYLDVVEALQLAAKDPKVIGLFCRLGNPNHPGVEMSHVQEIRAAVESFRNAKKVTVAFTESLDHGQNIAYYYLASAFEHIYAQPSGLFFLPGLSAEQPFVKGLLEKLEMEFVGERREKHKNMWDLLTEKKFTPEHKENVDNILSALNEHIITKIAQGRLHAIRRLPNNQNVDLQGAIKIVNEWFDIAGITGKEAKSLGVIDEFGYKNEVRKSDTSKLCGVKEDKATFLFLSKYLEKKGGNSLSKPKTNPAKELTSYKRQTVAVVYATGNIHRGEAPSGYDDPAKKSIYGDTVASALRNAAEDKSVKCIIFRVNSGGGDAIGSELINHEIERIRNEKKIKVVVSVGSVAASGGYWISMNADSIVCNETSIMGSIGVVFGKLYTREFWENKLGITYDQIKKNKLADINSSLHKYDDEQQQVMKKLTDEIYDDFKQRVSNARNIPREDVDQMAQGKVYMGVEAKRLKLVDELGGFDKAVEVAKQLLNVPPEHEVDLVEYPKTVPFFKKFLANKKPAENADEQDKKRAFAQSGSSAVGFLYSMIMGGDSIFTRFARVFLGNSGLSKLQDITNAGGVQAVDHTSISL